MASSFFNMKGDKQALKLMTDGFKAAGTRVVSRATKAMAGQIESLYQRGFYSHADPWGEPWAGTVSGGRAGFRSGAMMAAIPTLGVGIVRMRPARYWGYFQAGAPQRKDGQERQRGILPFSKSKWDQPIESSIVQVMDVYFGSLKT